MITLKSLRYGVEIEVGGRTREAVANAVQSVVGGTIRHIGGPPYDPWSVTAPDGREWRVVADSSLSAFPQDQRAEVVSPILTWDDMETVQQIVRALRRLGCSVNGQAGLHVHIDGNSFTGKTLAILAKQVYANEELIFHAFGVSEERKARYTKPLDPAFIQRLGRRKPVTREAFFQCWYNTKNYAPTRYHASRYYVAPRIMWRHRLTQSQPRRFVPHNIQPHWAVYHLLFTSTPPFTLVLRRKSSLSRPGTGLSSVFE